MKGRKFGEIFSDYFAALTFALTASEDLNKLIATGETPEEMQARQRAEGGPRRDPKTGDYIEPDIREANIDMIKAAGKRTGPDAAYDIFVDNEGNTVPADLVKGEHGLNVRLHGNLHVDFRTVSNSGKINVWHWDCYGSAGKNIFTALHHPLFESLPHDYLRPYLGQLGYSHYYYYRYGYLIKHF
jgi:hypothetical protein